MYNAGAAYDHEKFEDKKVVVCPLNNEECRYNNSNGEFKTEDERIMHKCNTKGLVEKTGLIDITQSPFKEKIPNIEINENKPSYEL